MLGGGGDGSNEFSVLFGTYGLIEGREKKDINMLRQT